MNSLGNIENEQQYFMRCPECGQQFALRRLDEVFKHEQYQHRIPVLDYTYSAKTGKPALYFKNLVPIIVN